MLTKSMFQLSSLCRNPLCDTMCSLMPVTEQELIDQFGFWNVTVTAWLDPLPYGPQKCCSSMSPTVLVRNGVTSELSRRSSPPVMVLKVNERRLVQPPIGEAFAGAASAPAAVVASAVAANASAARRRDGSR